MVVITVRLVPRYWYRNCSVSRAETYHRKICGQGGIILSYYFGPSGKVVPDSRGEGHFCYYYQWFHPSLSHPNRLRSSLTNRGRVIRFARRLGHPEGRSADKNGTRKTIIYVTTGSQEKIDLVSILNPPVSSGEHRRI